MSALLRAPGIDVNKAMNNNGQTPLYIASYNGKTECVTALLRAPGIDVNKADNGKTPLSVAYNADIKKLLLAHGAK